MQLSETQPNLLPSWDEWKTSFSKRSTEDANSMNQQDFLNLLIVQMKNQDPLDPMDNAEFTSQTTAFSQLEQMINMNKGMQELVESQKAMTQANQSLIQSTNFLGKYIRYDTNTLKKEGVITSPVSFYSDGVAQRGQVSIYNGSDQLVGSFSITDVKKGENHFAWDGKGIGGVNLEDGMYYFDVYAINDGGKAVTIATYGESVVKGVTINGGKMYFEVGNGLVPADSVYSVMSESDRE